jgi:hypothetical protein
MFRVQCSAFIRCCASCRLLRFGEHFGNELSRGLRAQQLLLRQLGRTGSRPRFLLALRLQSAPIRSMR